METRSGRGGFYRGFCSLFAGCVSLVPCVLLVPLSCPRDIISSAGDKILAQKRSSTFQCRVPATEKEDSLRWEGQNSTLESRATSPLRLCAPASDKETRVNGNRSGAFLSPEGRIATEALATDVAPGLRKAPLPSVVYLSPAGGIIDKRDARGFGCRAGRTPTRIGVRIGGKPRPKNQGGTPIPRFGPLCFSMRRELEPSIRTLARPAPQRGSA